MKSRSSVEHSARQCAVYTFIPKCATVLYNVMLKVFHLCCQQNGTPPAPPSGASKEAAADEDGFTSMMFPPSQRRRRGAFSAEVFNESDLESASATRKVPSLLPHRFTSHFKAVCQVKLLLSVHAASVATSHMSNDHNRTK